MNNELNKKTVVLKTYETLIEANYDLESLKSNSIPCFISNVDRLYPVFDSPLGGIKLNIFKEDMERALMLLNKIHTKDDTLD